MRDAGFGDAAPLRDFLFDNTMITTFVERWRPETHTFHMPWGECTITLQDVAYHLGLRTDGDPVGGCFRDFQAHYHTRAWEMVERLLGAKLLVVVQQGAQRREDFSLKVTWLRDRLRQMPPNTSDLDTLRQYARCYIMLMIRGYLGTDKSNNTVHLRWLPLLDDFERCHRLSWGSSQIPHRQCPSYKPGG
ncbi:serine/threonine-protein phosphatase 7 long form homolog [Arachis stenosperma]|uniref:serine/threonine-protein phosphatase 7 long form homolog n=1 Tax=Arachis stenosperma TaxID=217475 RepID=UPI0025AC763D|nr:serine/threonine-protein phosphatase 7 long form homolog [Arachis stenosperma]